MRGQSPSPKAHKTTFIHTGFRTHPIPPIIGGRIRAIVANMARSSSPPALRGVVRHLPAGLAGAALHIPVGLTLLNCEDGFNDDGIGRVPVLTRRKVAEGGWVKWVEPSTTVGGVGTKGCFAEKATSDRRCGIGCRLVWRSFV